MQFIYLIPINVILFNPRYNTTSEFMKIFNLTPIKCQLFKSNLNLEIDKTSQQLNDSLNIIDEYNIKSPTIKKEISINYSEKELSQNLKETLKLTENVMKRDLSDISKENCNIKKKSTINNLDTLAHNLNNYHLIFNNEINACFANVVIQSLLGCQFLLDNVI